MPVFPGTQLRLKQFPPECPKCHRAIAAVPGANYENTADKLEAVFSCPRCRKLFVAIFVFDHGLGTYSFSHSENVHPGKLTFDKIDAISPRFVTIYNQALFAESYALDDISGIGYRKSLEFLIKDYCIHTHPENDKEIKKAFLGNVIQKFLENGRMKDAAERTAWLGNDESHYERRWVGKDLQDLKNLLRLTISAIDEALEYEFYMAEMAKPAKVE